MWLQRLFIHFLSSPFSRSGAGVDPGFFLGGCALVSYSTSTPINHIVFFLQNTSCIKKPQVNSVVVGGGGLHPLHPPPRSVPVVVKFLTLNTVKLPCATTSCKRPPPISDR